MSNRNVIEQEVITSRFVNNWVPLFPDVPVRYENRNFTPPINEPWVGFAIRSGRVTDAAISTVLPRGIGIVFLQIFLPENAGTVLARVMADSFGDVFDNWHIAYPANPPYPKGDFWFKRAEFIPLSPHDGWLQWNVTIEFKHDEQIVVPLGSASGGIPEAPTDGQLYGRQSASWNVVPVGDGTGDMLKSVYDADGNGVVDTADAIPWTGVTGKPATFPPDTTAERVANKGIANGYAALDVGGKVPVAQLPTLSGGDMNKAVYDANNDNVVDHAALADTATSATTAAAVPWTGVTGKPAAYPPDATGMLKSVYDTNGDNIVDHAALADTAPWTGVTGKPTTFPPDASAMLKSVYDTNSNNVVDHAELADTATSAGSVPWSGVTSKPSTFPPDSSAMLKSVYDANADNIVDHAALADAIPWTGVTGKPTTYPPDNTAMLKATYDANGDNIVDHAALADTATNASAVPWAGVTSKPVTFPPDSTAELVARKGVANGYAGLDATGKVPTAQLPTAGLADAPSDGKMYARKNAAWTQPWTQLTQAQYDALAPPDPNTLYIVVG